MADGDVAVTAETTMALESAIVVLAALFAAGPRARVLTARL